MKAVAITQAAAPRFTKLDAAGLALLGDTPTWEAVEDTKTGLIWTVAETKEMSWKSAVKFPAKLTTCGFTDWRLPSCDDLLTLVDRSRYSPAIDTAYFPDCKPDWYWTSTPLASSPGVCAWLVNFLNGGAYWNGQYYSGLVRAVRPRQ